MTAMEIEGSLFDDVADALRGMTPAALGPVHHRARRYGIKVWFGGATPPREHYEAQVIGPDDDRRANHLALEVGFHSEYAQAADNDAVITHLLAGEKRWRKIVGNEAEVGPFLGRQASWRRVSETWPDPDLSEPGLAFEVAARLVDYVSALEPARAKRR